MTTCLRQLCCCLLLSAAGCAPYTRAKIDLVEQSRHGLKQIDTTLSERQALIEQLHRHRRAQLDGAFDADVRNRASLTADWVIAARKAYGVGIDALARQQVASLRAHETTSANLHEIDRALQQLQWLHQLEMRLSLPEIRP